MTKTTRKILVAIMGLLVFIAGLFALGFHAMEIEDHYGDLQDFYFKSKNGDLMILGNYKKIGRVFKTRTSIRIVNSQKDTVDLYNWFHDQSSPVDTARLFRPKNDRSLPELDAASIRQSIQKNEIMRILDFPQ